MIEVSDFNSFFEFINKDGENYKHIALPLDLQHEFHLTYKKLIDSKWYSKKIDKEKLLQETEKLYSPNVPLDEKKELIVKFSFIDDINFYKALKKYEKFADKELKNWVKIAIKQSEVILENSLGELNNVLIFSGLGGKKDKIRFFGTFFLRYPNNKFSEYQKLVIKNELLEGLKSYNCELEKLYFNNFFAAFIFLAEIKSNLGEILKKILEEINVYGNFLKNNFIITNIKIPSIKEIKMFTTQQK